MGGTNAVQPGAFKKNRSMYFTQMTAISIGISGLLFYDSVSTLDYMEGLLYSSTGRRKLIRLTIVVAIGLQVIFGLMPRMHNYSFPLSPETLQAVQVWQTNRTTETETAVWKQLHRNILENERQAEWRGLIWLASFVSIDFAAIYFFWNRGKNKIAI